jgi:hypothetical protein
MGPEKQGAHPVRKVVVIVAKCLWRALFFILLLASPLCAQDVGEEVPRRLLFSVVRAQEAAFTENDMLMISRSLFVRLQAATTEIVVVESEGEWDSEAELAVLAKSVGADCWASVAVSGRWSAMRLRVRSFDLLSSEMVVDMSIERPRLAAARDLPTERWDDIVQAVAGNYHALQIVAAPQPGTQPVVLTIKALPGTRVTGLGGPALQVGQDGSVSRELAAPREYLLKAFRPGYFTESKRIFLSSSRELTFAQKLVSRWTLETALQEFAYPGMDVAWFALPDQAFLKLGFTTYVVGLALNTSGVFVSEPLTNVTAVAGFYLLPPGGLFRPYIGVGAFLRLVHAPGSYFGLDPLSAWGARGIVGTEFLGSARDRFFLEYTPALYSTGLPDLFRAAIGPENLAPGWLLGTTYAASLLSFRVGYRWLL